MALMSPLELAIVGALAAYWFIYRPLVRDR
jgi:hypothetical protein